MHTFYPIFKKKYIMKKYLKLIHKKITHLLGFASMFLYEYMRVWFSWPAILVV